MISMKKIFALLIAVLTLGLFSAASFAGLFPIQSMAEPGCECEQSGGECACGVVLGCGCVGDGLRIISDTVYYLVLGQPFILDLEAEGGTEPYAWSVESETLPIGLRLSAGGSIEGTPEIVGSFRLAIRVEDAENKTASKKFTFLVVENEELLIMTDTLPDAQVGRFYTARVRGCGGAKLYGWTIENLPVWLTLDDSGILSGLPTEAQIHDLLVRVSDHEDSADSKLLRLSVYPHDGLLISTNILPAALYGQDYSARLEAIGGIPPYFFAIRRGSYLPPSLTLNGDGSISGAPTQKGLYDFVIDVMDGNSLQGSASYTMAVLDSKAINADNDFGVLGNKGEKEILLSFYLPSDFDEARILAVEPQISPDLYIGRSASSVTRGDGGYKVESTLYVTDGGSRDRLMKELAFEGFVVKFDNASGEDVRFEKALFFKDLKKTEEDIGNGGGGCNAGLGVLPLFSLFGMLKTVFKNGILRR
ncbi:MAG: Ig domain-containing protein [Synergistaceae bacterium]|nr:Ig domain-containing protein [Synergistaceae bacterium]